MPIPDRAPDTDTWLWRDHHDPDRPVVDTAEAGRRLGLSRQSITDQIRSGRLEGYGIRSARRTRWWVYASALTATSMPDDALQRIERERDSLLEANTHLRELLELRDAMDQASADLDRHLRAAGEARLRIGELQRRVSRLTADVVQASAGPQSPADLLRHGRG